MAMGLSGHQFHVDLDVVAGHAHFRLVAVGADQFGDRAGDVRGAEIELRPIAGEERRVPAAFFLGQDVDVGLEIACAA